MNGGTEREDNHSHYIPQFYTTLSTISRSLTFNKLQPSHRQIIKQITQKLAQFSLRMILNKKFFISVNPRFHAGLRRFGLTGKEK